MQLLSRSDRTRVIPGNHAVPLPPGNGATTGTFLVDGIWQGTWQIRDQTLHIQPFTKLRRADRNALLAEAGLPRLLAWRLGSESPGAVSPHWRARSHRTASISGCSGW